MAVDYRVVRSNRKTISVEVTRETEVIVRAPRATGDARIAEFVAAHETWIARAIARQSARAAAYPEPDEEEAARLRTLAKAYLPARTAHFAAIMGVQPRSVKITSARTRFGSCSADDRICYSYHLMRYPPEAIDYVVVHELAHIIHKNHAPAFYACVAQYLPDYESRRALLRGPAGEDTP